MQGLVGFDILCIAYSTDIGSRPTFDWPSDASFSMGDACLCGSPKCRYKDINSLFLGGVFCCCSKECIRPLNVLQDYEMLFCISSTRKTKLTCRSSLCL